MNDFMSMTVTHCRDDLLKKQTCLSFRELNKRNKETEINNVVIGNFENIV
jgi:hypothetical protein